MKLKFKKFSPKAVTPAYANPGDAGLDLTCVTISFGVEGFIEYETSLGVEIPEGYVGLVFPRSSISKYPTRLANSVGVIDSSYRGSIKVRMRSEDGHSHYKEGDKIAQLVVVPFLSVELEEVKELSPTNRGVGSFGSTGV